MYATEESLQEKRDIRFYLRHNSAIYNGIVYDGKNRSNRDMESYTIGTVDYRINFRTNTLTMYYGKDELNRPLGTKYSFRKFLSL